MISTLEEFMKMQVEASYSQLSNPTIASKKSLC